MLPQQWGVIEHRRDVAKSVFNPVQGAIKELGLQFSDAPNALYGPADLTATLIRMSERGNYAGVVSDAARENEASRMEEGGDGKRIPTPQWALGKLREVPDDDAERVCKNMVRCSVRRARRVGMLRGPVTIAFDTTLSEFYGEPIEDYDLLVRSRSKNGTNDFVGHLAVQGIGPTSKVFLGASHLQPGADIAAMVGVLLNDIRRYGIRAVLSLLDRGFYNAGIMIEIDRRNMHFLMPAVKSKPIKEIIRKHAEAVKEGKSASKAVVEYTVHGKAGDFTHRLAILPRKDYEGSDPVEAYVVFATNLSRRNVLRRIEGLSREYKERWEIETGFRCVKASTGMTRSRSVSVRLILIFFAMMLYNFWIIVKFSESGGGDAALWDRCIKAEEFLRALLAVIRPLLCDDTRGIAAAEPGKGGG